MTNMSYCRMRNTANDLMDAYDNMDDVVWANEGDRDKDEYKAALRIIKLAKMIVADYGDAVD